MSPRYYVSYIIGFVLNALENRLPRRVIKDRDGKDAYLTRVYLLGRKPRMPDGSHPFDSFGNPKPGIVWPDGSYGLYLHKFHKPDMIDVLHNHPWDWACSLVLSGGYRELRRRPRETTQDKVVRTLDFNVLTSKDFHGVVELYGVLGNAEVWTLFLVGPRSQSWGFLDWRDNFTDWREFLNVARIDGEQEGDG